MLSIRRHHSPFFPMKSISQKSQLNLNWTFVKYHLKFMNFNRKHSGWTFLEHQGQISLNDCDIIPLKVIIICIWFDEIFHFRTHFVANAPSIHRFRLSCNISSQPGEKNSRKLWKKRHLKKRQINKLGMNFSPLKVTHSSRALLFYLPVKPMKASVARIRICLRIIA